MKRFAIAGLTLSLCLFAATALAADTSARAQLQAFASGLHSLSGQFEQTLTNANGQRIKTSRGKVALKAPRQFRWQTTAPYKQLIVADGAHVWMYEPDLEQVTVRKQSTAEAHSPLTVLTDIDRLGTDFKSTELGTRDGLDWLRLTPKDKQAHFAYAELGFSDGSLRAMRFKDQLGNVTRIRFSHWQRNRDLPASTFNFTPPKGADVIGDTSSVPSVKPLQH
ncbi:MAG TPA: outer membrane lipoprotein chaperone LolA [Oleiagrimonas sp.]|nr:outer membrane lipoprotein chaperone LolA [Oleiagrimonas sp.]